MLSAIFAATPNDPDHLKYLASVVLTHDQQITINEIKKEEYTIRLLHDLVDYQSGDWHDVLKDVGLFDDRAGIHSRVTGYCLNVVQLYGKAFLTTFLFKIRGQAAFLVNLKAFLDDSCLPTMDTLDQQFHEETKLQNTYTLKKELASVDALIEAEILCPPGRKETFAKDLVRLLYEILYDDTTIGRKGQSTERVEAISPYLLRTKKTTQQRPHLDSKMGTKTELASNVESVDTSHTRRSKRARNTVATYNEDAVSQEPTKQTIEITDDDRRTRTYLPWSIDVPLIQDCFYLNVWLIDHSDAKRFMTRQSAVDKTNPENWQIGIRIQIPPGAIFLWRNDLVHSGCYAGEDLRKKPSDHFDAVHVGVGGEQGEMIVSNCERMHAYLPTTSNWVEDLLSRTPSTYGTLDVFTPFDGTLGSSKIREWESKEYSGKIPELVSFLFWPNKDGCGTVLKTGRKFPKNRTAVFSKQAKTGDSK